jgi:hypothetical protein
VNTRAVMMRGSRRAKLTMRQEHDGKDPATKALGKKGGAARAKSMTRERRTEISKVAAEVAGDTGN